MEDFTHSGKGVEQEKALLFFNHTAVLKKLLLCRNSSTFRTATYVYGSEQQHTHANMQNLRRGQVKGLQVLHYRKEVKILFPRM